MTLKHFPIGVQDFEWLRVSGKYYVDKTDLIYKLTHTDDYYFLARPRRFGKSLLLSTLQCYFEGRKELFDGLAMERLCELRAFLSAVPYDADKKNELHYKTIVYCVFSLATPYFVRCEEKSAAGRCDVLVETPTSVSAFEFKLNANGTADDAVSQIESRGYLIPYTVSLDADGNPKRLFKVGVAFDSERRTLGEWKIVEA